MPLACKAPYLRFLALACLAFEGACLTYSGGETQSDRKLRTNHVSNSNTNGRGSMLIVLNGEPPSHDLLLEQGKRVLTQSGQVMLTSHEDAELPMNGDKELVHVHAIKPNEFCSAPAVGAHKRKCDHAPTDNKLLGSAFMANLTNHGFRWLLLGDDDTSFYLQQIEEALSQEEYSPKDPHYLGIRIGKTTDKDTRPTGYEKALTNCPRLGPSNTPRFWSINTTADITDINRDCDAKPFRDDSWFSWARGGHGILLSAGLLDRISTADWQQCVDRIVTFGGDVRLALCLALLGYRVEKLEEGATGKLSEHKLDLGVPSQQAEKNKPNLTKGEALGRKRQIGINELKRDTLFAEAVRHTDNAESVSENCSSWQGLGMSCERDFAGHIMLRKWIPKDATVLEFGARFGTTSCEIAKLQNNSGNLVVVEPDPHVWDDLQANLDRHSCNAHVVRGAVSDHEEIHMSVNPMAERGYFMRPMGESGTVVPGFSFEVVERAMGSGKMVDTLLFNCAGCAQDMLEELSTPLKSGKIKLIIIAGDMATGSPECHHHCMDYTKFGEFLQKMGYEQVDEFKDCDRRRTFAPKGQACNKYIDHFAYRLRSVNDRNTIKMVHKLRKDSLYYSQDKTWTGAVKTISEGCKTWRGKGLDCELEFPERSLVKRWVLPNSTVMEFGAEHGTTSCEIASIQKNSGNLIVVEPDRNVWRDLEANLDKHNCNAHVLKGAISHEDFRLSAERGGKKVPGFRLEEVERAAHKGVDTFVIDCEDCVEGMMDQIQPPISKGQIKLIVMQIDKSKHVEFYKNFFSFLVDTGFEKVEEWSDCDNEAKKCSDTVEHYAYRMK